MFRRPYYPKRQAYYAKRYDTLDYDELTASSRKLLRTAGNCFISRQFLFLKEEHAVLLMNNILEKKKKKNLISELSDMPPLVVDESRIIKHDKYSTTKLNLPRWKRH